MKKTALIVNIFLLLGPMCFAQNTNKKFEVNEIGKTVRGYLKWYKSHSTDTSLSLNKLIIYREDTEKTVGEINWDVVNYYLNSIKKSNFVTDSYLDSFRRRFVDIETSVNATPIQNGAIIKIDGLDSDPVLQSFEPEEVLDYIDSAKIIKSAIIADKAIVVLRFSIKTKMVFTLSKIENDWLIDYLGYNN